MAVVATGLERFWWWSTVGSEFRLHRYRRDGGGPQLDRWRHILREEGHAMAFTVIERDLRRGVSFLGFVVGAAPMLGILGTVLGLAKALGALGAKLAPKSVKNSTSNCKTALGPLLGDLGAIFGLSWAVLGLSWGGLGAVLGQDCFVFRLCSVCFGLFGLCARARCQSDSHASCHRRRCPPRKSSATASAHIHRRSSLRRHRTDSSCTRGREGRTAS